MFELKTSLESCTDLAKGAFVEVLHFIAAQDVGKRALLAEALLKEVSSFCAVGQWPQRSIGVPDLDRDRWEDEAARDRDAAAGLGVDSETFSESCVDTLVDSAAFLAAIPQEEQGEFSSRLLEIAEDASIGIDEAVRRDRLSNS